MLTNETYNEIPITSFPPFESYMSNSCKSSIFMEDCNEQEILGIINDLQNGKASEIPIVTIKVARTVISPYNNIIAVLHLKFFQKSLKSAR